MIRKKVIQFKGEVRQCLNNIQILPVKLNPNETSCPQCQSEMKVRNVRSRRLITIEHGVVSFRITTLICKKGCKTPDGRSEIRRPEELEYLMPPGANIGYDVGVFCGIKRYLDGLQREEIKKQLEVKYGIFISSRKISVLANQFVEHFNKLHISRSQAFRDILNSDGGTPWHVDATGEEGSGTILIVYSGWRKWVLGAWKITTECKEQIKPLLHETANRFGNPLAVVRDYGKGMTPAIEEFVQERKAKIGILGCHTHFIKFVGKNLLTSEYNALRQLIRNHNIKANLRKFVRVWSKKIGEELSDLKTKIKIWITPDQAQPLPKGYMGITTVRAMAQSALDYLENNKNQRFPFVMPYVEFSQRCITLFQACKFYMDHSDTDESVLKMLKQLVRILDPVISDSSFESIDQTLSYRFKLFMELRTALRLESNNNTKRVTPGAQEPKSVVKELNDIKKALEKYKSSLRRLYRINEPDEENQRQAINIILKYLDEHKKNLWGHVIQIPKLMGGGVKIICRTNNCLENFNGRLKQDERKRSGRKVLTKDFEDLPEGVPLIKNLKNPDYVEVLCESLEKLPEAIAKLDRDERVRKKLDPTQPAKIWSPTTSLPKDDRQFIRKINIALLIQNAAAQNVQKNSISTP